MARPAGYQWEPLGWDTDPVPGDPQVIGAEAAQLLQTARQVAEQVAALQKISADGTQIGQTPDVIRSSASNLAGQLTNVAARYQNVAAALRGWGPELEQAQLMSLQALDQAEIPYAKLQRQITLPSGTNLSAAQKETLATHQASMRQAQEQLDAAKAQLNRAISLRDTQAAYYQARINAATNDGLTDHESWWEHFEDWVASNAYLIRDICTALEVVATILAVVALFIPGLDIVALLLIAGMVLTTGALLGRVLLAVTGNGSWFDVAMDVIALASFGVGKLATSGLKTLAESGQVLGKTLVTAERADMVVRSEQFVAKGGDLFSDDAVARIMTKQVANIEKLVPQVGKFTGKLPLLTRMALRLAGAAPEDFENVEKIAALAERYGGNEAVAKIMGSAHRAVIVLGANAGINLSSSIGVPAIGGLELDNAHGQPIHLGDVPLKVNLPDNPLTDAYNDIEADTPHSESPVELAAFALTGGLL
jgi:hypothetical protein